MNLKKVLKRRERADHKIRFTLNTDSITTLLSDPPTYVLSIMDQYRMLYQLSARLGRSVVDADCHLFSVALVLHDIESSVAHKFDQYSMAEESKFQERVIKSAEDDAVWLYDPPESESGHEFLLRCAMSPILDHPAQAMCAYLLAKNNCDLEYIKALKEAYKDTDSLVLGDPSECYMEKYIFEALVAGAVTGGHAGLLDELSGAQMDNVTFSEVIESFKESWSKYVHRVKTGWQEGAENGVVVDY